MKDSSIYSLAALTWIFLVLAGAVALGTTQAYGQQSSSAPATQSPGSEQLNPVEIEAPRADRRQTLTGGQS
jgi:hypothetical protein